MDPNCQDPTKKIPLEDLSKEDLIKKCRGLIGIAQKAKQAKDTLQEENNDLKKKLERSLNDASGEIIENLTQQKLQHVTTIEELKNKLQKTIDELNRIEQASDVLDNENISLNRQVKRLTQENEQLITDLEMQEKEIDELKKIGLQQQQQLLLLEQQSNNTKPLEEKLEILKMNLAEKDKNILIISEDLKAKNLVINDLKQSLTDSEELRKQLESLNKIVKEKDLQIEALKNTPDSQLSKSMDDILQLQTENAALKENIKELTDNKELQENNRQQLEQWLKDLEQANKELYENQVKQADESNKNLTEELDNLKIKLSEKDNEIASLETNLKEKQELIVNLHFDISQISEELINKNLEIDGLKDSLKMIEEKNLTITSLEKNISLVSQELNNKNKAIDNLNDSINEKHSEVNEKTAAILELEKTVVQISEELNKKNLEIEELRDSLNRTVNEKELEISDLKNSSTSSLEETVEKLREKLRMYHRKLVKFAGNVKSLKEDRNEVLKSFKDYTNEVENWKNQLNNGTQRIINYVNEVEKENKILKENNLRKTDDEKSEELAEIESVKSQNQKLLEEIDVLKKESASCKMLADKAAEEIMNLIEENKKLNQQLTKNNSNNETQTDLGYDLEEMVSNLKRENTEVLAEMNEMNQVLKERGEIISQLDAHCDEIKKKLQIYETQANRNVVDITQKEEQIKALQQELEVAKERLNGNFDYAESETMSTSTISRGDEVNRLKELEGSWEERYGKLRNLALKLKGKIRDLTNELTTQQHNKADLEHKLNNNVQINANLQGQINKLEDETKQKINTITEYEQTINQLKKDIDELTKEKTNTENWKKQIGSKVQALRKEQEANKLIQKEYESRIAQLTAQLEEKTAENFNNERIKNSVLSLEMQDYEKSVKELSQKLSKKQDEIVQLSAQLETQKSTIKALREQNKVLEERFAKSELDLSGANNEVLVQKNKITELEEFIVNKDEKIQNLTQLIETLRSENEELSTELSKVIAEHQKVNSSLKSEKELLRSQNLGLQQSLRETQDTLRLTEEELTTLRSDYENYKVRAQSVLRQNQNRDVGVEEKLSEEAAALRGKCQNLEYELEDNSCKLRDLKKENETLKSEREELSIQLQEATGEIEDLKSIYDQLSVKHEQTIMEHAETVRSLKVHAETLAQCYRQQIADLESRHNREILELQNKLDKAPSPVEPHFPAPTMPREEGEGSESVESVNRNNMPVPLERLLGIDSDLEYSYVKKQLTEQQSKVAHLTALLADTEQDLAKHVQMNKLLKEEIRRQQRSVEREKHAENLEYLKNVVFKFVTLHSGDERARLVPVLNTILKLSPDETQKLSEVAKSDPGLRGWASSYLPSWSPSK